MVKRRGDAGLLEEDHAVAGANHPAVADSIGQSHARTEVAALQFAGGVGKIQNLRLQIEDGPLIVLLRRWEVQRVAGADVQREPRRDLPVVADEELGDVRARLNHLFLNVDGERVHLPQKERGQRISASGDRGTVRAGGGERERPGGIGRVQNIQSLAPEIGSELDRVPAAHQRKRVEELGDGRREVGVRGGGRADLLESGDGEDRQHRSEGICRQAGHRDSAVLKRGLIEIAPGIAKRETGSEPKARAPSCSRRRMRRRA